MKTRGQLTQIVPQKIVKKASHATRWTIRCVCVCNKVSIYVQQVLKRASERGNLDPVIETSQQQEMMQTWLIFWVEGDIFFCIQAAKLRK